MLPLWFQTWRISVRLSDYLSTFVQAFNSTASVHRVKAEARPEDEEGVDFEFEDDAWVRSKSSSFTSTSASHPFATSVPSKRMRKRSFLRIDGPLEGMTMSDI